MKIKLILGLTAFVLVTFLTGCNKAPQMEVDAAKVAIIETQSFGSDVYLPEEFSALNDSMNVIMLGIEAKKSKWFARYDEETEKLNNILVTANTLKQNTEIRKNEIKEEVLVVLENVKTVLAENQELLAKAPKGKEGTAALVAISDELNVLNASVSEITMMVDEGDYLNAQSKAAAVNEKATAINLELKGAISKSSIPASKK